MRVNATQYFSWCLTSPYLCQENPTNIPDPFIQRLINEISLSFLSTSDTIVVGIIAIPQSLHLWEDEPNPMALFPPTFQFTYSPIINSKRNLRFQKAMNIIFTFKHILRFKKFINILHQMQLANYKCNNQGIENQAELLQFYHYAQQIC